MTAHHTTATAAGTATVVQAEDALLRLHTAVVTTTPTAKIPATTATLTRVLTSGVPLHQVDNLTRQWATGATTPDPTGHQPLATFLVTVNPGDLHTWADEARHLTTRHGEYLHQLTEDIRTNGIRQPVLIGTDGRCWDGHHRVIAAARLGHTTIPVTYACTGLHTCTDHAKWRVTRNPDTGPRLHQPRSRHAVRHPYPTHAHHHRTTHHEGPLMPIHNCPGLFNCTNHPRWHVTKARPLWEGHRPLEWWVYPPGRYHFGTGQYFATREAAFVYAQRRANHTRSNQ